MSNGTRTRPPVTSEQLHRWWNLCSELDGHLLFIKDAEEKKRASAIVDQLEREIYESYTDVMRAEVDAMCAASTEDAPTLVEVNR